ncbi:RND transporter [Pseudolabrys taiwanensis]|uniref:RND transporter n=1 Tax=Pseudolabrys taiwanensis TaxID=331696 RepID=A0A346A199_9HYPH|nr:MMPL family transporter [Pseudolabrys taiwanensis]AXK82946.1 RND transporter [Pseudolabrys taiwanensis]
MGFVALRFPLATAVVFLLLLVAGAVGFARLKVDDSLSQLFRSDTPEYQTYEEVTRRFPASEYDVLVVIDGGALLTRPSLEKLRNLAIDLQLVDGTRGLISIFSAREPPQNGGVPAPLFPQPLPSGEAYKALIDRVMANEIIHGKLLSDDGRLTLMVLALDPAAVDGGKLANIIGEVRETVNKDLAGSGLNQQLSGVPVMQLEIRNAIERDRLIYNTLGFAAGCLIAILFFRRVSFMIIAAAPPLAAILMALGALGWLDFRLNMFLNVMTPLIMVISFSDSMQLTFAARDRLIAGEDKVTAFRNALYVVGPACVLTHATAAISFIALTFSRSDLIRAFGEAGLIAVVVAMVTVLVLVPLLGLLLIRHEARFAESMRGMDRALDVLRRVCEWIAVRMVSRPGLYSLIALVAVGLLSAGYTQLVPRYRLADQVPDREQAVAASQRLDAKLTGANPIDVLIELPAGKSLYDPETLAAIADVHAAVQRQAGVGNVWSLETLRRWLTEKLQKSDVATLKEYVDLLPSYLTRRFISAKQDAVIVSGRVPDVDASKLLPVIQTLDKQLDAVRAKYPGYKIAVTGLSAIAARNSAIMIDRLSQALTIEIVFVAAFIGLAFQSPIVMLVSILPGIFPIVLAGSLLWLLGLGLQFASVIALTVSFGLGLSATIHFLNRLQIEDAIDADASVGVERATVLVGPPLILTSAVLACGLAMTVFSSLPSLRLFGWLSAFSMIAALFADLFILRPVAMYLSQVARRFQHRTLAGRRAR